MTYAYSVVVESQRLIDLGVSAAAAASSKTASREQISLLARAIASPGAYGIKSISVMGANSPVEASPAISGVNMTGASGTVGLTIGGVAYTAATGGTPEDTANAVLGALFVDQLSAGVLVYGGTNVLAVRANVNTVLQVGDELNVCGVTFVAVAASAPNVLPGQFKVAGTIAGCITNLAAAINKIMLPLGFAAVHDSVAQPGDLLVLQQTPFALEASSYGVVNAGGRMTLGANGVCEYVFVYPTQPGAFGNLAPVTATGAGVALEFVTAGAGVGGGLLVQNF